jgi:ADP-ribosyl-[dinitrogen reductase] hydrolase
MSLSILLRTAQGDAYGAGFEYGSAEHVAAKNTLSGFVKNEKHTLVPSFYTDDTQMALANAEVIVSGVPITREALADSYVDCFKRDQREGYARGFYSLLCEIKDGTELLARLGDARSDKSGGAMRAVVWGIFPTVNEVKRLTELQARITHNTIDGVNAAFAAALGAHYFLYGIGKKKDLGLFLETHVRGDHCDWSKSWNANVGSKGWESIHAAISAVIENDSMSAILKTSIGYVGDVDTVAAVALGVASCCPEVENDLPAWLYDDLENGAYGRDYLVAMDEKLSALFARFKDSVKS